MKSLAILLICLSSAVALPVFDGQSANITNRYMPMRVGANWESTGTGDYVIDDEGYSIYVAYADTSASEVLAEDMVDGIRCLKVRTEQVWDGEPETEFAWYAQDVTGAVWLIKLIDDWGTDHDDYLVMPINPFVGQVLEDGSIVTSVTGAVTVPAGSFTGCLQLFYTHVDYFGDVVYFEIRTSAPSVGPVHANFEGTTSAMTLITHVSGNPVSGALSLWRQTHFGSPDNSGDGADLNDFDKDGIPNFIEFAFGLDPTKDSAGLLPRPQRSGNDFVVSFAQPAGVSGIAYGAEWSQTLLAGSWTAVTDTGNTVASPPQHTFSVPTGTKTKLYMRLKVTSP
jgi:hypothetical protein